MADLLNIRKRIDEVDKEILRLLESRMELSGEVAESKKKTGKPIYDAIREEEKLVALSQLTSDEFNKTVVRDLFSQVMASSRRLQYMKLNSGYDLGFTSIKTLDKSKNTKVVFYGEQGAYTEEAMISYFDNEIESFSARTFEEVMEKVKTGEADYGVLPIENSFTGTLSDIFDLLSKYDNYIIGEKVLRIDHNLLGLSGAKTSEIEKVYSHSQGLLQCSEFLKENPHIKAIAEGSTAGSARKILEENVKTSAAIASRRAGDHFGLEILKASIHNESDNSTRFIIISNKPIYLQGANKISISFGLPHESGSLYHMLSHFIYNNINMTRIESRPFLGRPFEYRFFVDIEGEINDPKVKNALYSIEQEAREMKIIGSYITVASKEKK